MQSAKMPIEVFYAYAREDTALRDELEKHLSLIQRQGLIASWSDRQILPGSDWPREVDEHLSSAAIILLLISPDFLATDYYYGVEMQGALERHERGEIQVIPIILRPVDWQGAPFAHLQGLPRDTKPVTSWSNRDEAFFDIARGIRWTIEHLHGTVSYDALIPLVPLSPPQSMSYQVSSLSAQDQQDRQRFLTILRTRYRDVLEQSLQGAALITLGLQTKLEGTTQAAQLVFRHLNQTERVLPLGTSIEQVYAQAGGELLILGEPGAGKSTLLLHLAQQLLVHAERDEHQLLPVILNLSSWAQKRQPLREWLVEELFTSYRVPRKLGQQWVQSGQFLLLLDGLDEVAVSARGACIDAINAYRRDHLVPLVVCSRTTEYLAQQRRLMLQSAVVVQPLTEEQIDDYLGSAGSALSAVRAVLQKNTVLRELATSPLMLNILTLVYHGTPVYALPESGSQEEQQRQVFTSYVTRMLSSNTPPQSTHPQHMLKRLTWLARQMQQHGQTTFYLEQLQPSWLSGKWTQWAYDWLAVRLPGVFIGLLCISIILSLIWASPFDPNFSLFVLPCGLLGHLLSGREATQRSAMSRENARNTPWQRLPRAIRTGLGYGLVAGSVSWLLLGLDVGIGSGLFFGLFFGLFQMFLGKINTAKIPSQTSSPRIRNGLVLGLAFGLFAGLFLGLLDLFNGLFFGLLAGLFSGVFLGLGGGFISVLLLGKSTTVQPTDQLIWSWRSLKQSLFSKQHAMAVVQNVISLTLLWGLVVVLSNILPSSSLHGFPQMRWDTLVFLVLTLGLSDWLLIGLFQGIASKTIEGQHRVAPNQGIRHSARNGLVLGLVSVIIVGLISMLISGLNDAVLSMFFSEPIEALNDWVRWGLILGLCVGLLVGLLNGGLACLRHYVLRFLLWRAGSIPWNYVRFLDEAAHRILLRKVGGGYTFTHRLLQDYIASLDTPTQRSLEDIAALTTSLLPPDETGKQELQVQPSQWCICGYRDDRFGGRFCPRCGKQRGQILVQE